MMDRDSSGLFPSAWTHTRPFNRKQKGDMEHTHTTEHIALDSFSLFIFLQSFFCVPVSLHTSCRSCAYCIQRRRRRRRRKTTTISLNGFPKQKKVIHYFSARYILPNSFSP